MPEFESVKRIAGEVDTDVCGLARALEEDIDRCIEADVDLVHTFISTSPQHLKYQMNKTEDEVYDIQNRYIDTLDRSSRHGT